MRKIVALVVLLAAAVILWPREAAQAGSPCTVPKSWGRAVGMTNATFIMVAFEAQDGTVRVVPANCKPGGVFYAMTRTDD